MDITHLLSMESELHYAVGTESAEMPVLRKTLPYKVWGSNNGSAQV